MSFHPLDAPEILLPRTAARTPLTRSHCQRGRACSGHGGAECAAGLQVDDQREFRRLLNREVDHPSVSKDASGRSGDPWTKGRVAEGVWGFRWSWVVFGEADPFHLSAGSPSTGSKSLSRKDAVAPIAVI